MTDETTRKVLGFRVKPNKKRVHLCLCKCVQQKMAFNEMEVILTGTEDKVFSDEADNFQFFECIVYKDSPAYRLAVDNNAMMYRKYPNLERECKLDCQKK
jgi:hypothetical protein